MGRSCFGTKIIDSCTTKFCNAEMESLMEDSYMRKVSVKFSSEKALMITGEKSGLTVRVSFSFPFL